MIVLDARNVNYALAQGVGFIHREGVREPSRAGDVFRVEVPVTTIYQHPEERVCFHPWRDANPFFHLIESLWMIAGRDDLATLTRYVSTFGQFSDDGETVPGAYGKRWRDWFHTPDGVPGPGSDQLNWVVRRLRENPHDRRVVIQMWDAFVDPGRADEGGKDVPCNLIALPFVSQGKLNLTVFCRSNDMVLGAYGANAVHFSFLLEYLAARVGLPMGSYYQVSNNFHAYVENAGDPEACWPIAWGPTDPYARGTARVFPVFQDFGAYDITPNRQDPEAFDREREKWIQQDLALFFDEGPEVANRAARWPFLKRIAAPMALAHRHWKQNKGDERFLGALEILGQLPLYNDWRIAAEEWIMRRREKWASAQS